jgi:hypothetical protein
MIKDDYIVRIWPSGILTMGKVHFSRELSPIPIPRALKDRPMFKSLESYSNEGGVVKGEVYGYADNVHGFKHRLATPIEIKVFHLWGLNKKEDEIKQLYRQIVLESIL